MRVSSRRSKGCQVKSGMRKGEPVEGESERAVCRVRKPTWSQTKNARSWLPAMRAPSFAESPFYRNSSANETREGVDEMMQRS